MLEKLRKFSTTIFAKLFLFIVAIPFVFWGMGDFFRGGNLNTIVQIDNKKISSEKFINYIKIYSDPNIKVNDKAVENLLSGFIGDKLIQMEVKEFNIEITENSLAKIIKNQKIFENEGKFSRTKYEKFLIKNNLTAGTFEKNIINQEKKKQLLNLIGDGLFPSNFMINQVYNKINQKRKINIINLNDLFKQKIKLSENKITSYFNENKNSYKIVYKTIKFIEITPENLTSNNDFSNLFFEKIDQIDDLIIEGKSLNFISKKFNLKKINNLTINSLGEDLSNTLISNFPNKLVNSIFNNDESNNVLLLQNDDKYFAIEIIKTENIQKEIDDATVREDIVKKLENISKRKIISEFISKINSNNFKKEDFNNVAKDNNIEIKTILLNSINDDKNLKKELVGQIYLYPENKVIIATDIGMTENFLVYTASTEHVKIDKQSDDYNKYLNLSKVQMKSDLYNTYDLYLKNKYKIKINYKALDNIKNYFK